MSDNGLTASAIKNALIAIKTEQRKPIRQADFAGVKGWLFRATAKQMARYRRIMNDEDPDTADLGPAYLVAICFRDHEGKAVFDPKLDLALLAGFDDADIEPLFRACLRVNGYGTEAAEDILKNLLRITGADGLYDALASMGAPCPNCKAIATSTKSESGK